MKIYLESNLKVPSNHIRTLYDQQASRTAIIQAFIDLQKDHHIKKGDPILIFYAGHGTEHTAPSGWECGGPNSKIQAIIPQDYSHEEGRWVPVIPDRTLGALINGIAREKGDNITVIFDSCYSGSGTRAVYDELDSTARTIDIDDDLPADLDWDIIESVADVNDPDAATRTGMIAQGFERHGLRSHVLLSACGASQLARESKSNIRENDRGNFTQSLLSLFRRVGVHQLAYSDIPHLIDPIDRQDPQVEGDNRHRIIFNSSSLPSDVVTYTVRRHDGIYTMNAGAVHAISKGAQFTVYRDRASLLAGRALGILQVAHDTHIKSFSTTLTLPAGVPSLVLTAPGLAVSTRAGERMDLRIYVPFDATQMPIFYALFRQLQNEEPGRYRIAITEMKDDAQLQLTVANNAVKIDILDQRVTSYELDRIPFSVDLEVGTIHFVLQSAAHFYRHFNTTFLNNLIPSKLSIEFTEVTLSTNDFDESGFPRIISIKPNLIQGDMIDLVVRPWAKYGMKITNNTPWDIYPYVFAFNISNLSIDSHYQSTSGGGQFVADPPLKKMGGTLMLGHGAAGGQPFEYELPKNQDVDVTFLKFFFSTTPINLSGVPQCSPFDGARYSVTSTVTQNVPETIGTKVIPLIQRRFPKTRS
ncbi:hypothetical protein GALMADRAFT_227766 [Galerina marginata CBS 339.88]|uniref:Peptidase C14 caspase domain-containing protein n=1 Tax=Galerina marginata (strain CBS 339.88) TaxID=685588 RepID=A0A067SVJ2_GALM3|nr:hypothetical protein GALMADRAFT_227766 [Galerina marginata CBS 339.88]